MTLKDLLVHLDPEPASAPRLEAAIALAAVFDARLVAYCPVVLPAAPLVELPPEREFRGRREAEADRVLTAAAEQARLAGVALEGRRECAPADRLPELFARQARHADLAVVGASGGGPDPQGVELPALTETAFLGTGRPALVVPSSGAFTMPPAHVLVAWDGSREAARAVHDALPLLVRATRVAIIVVDPERLDGAVSAKPGASLASHLAAHGARVDVVILHGGGEAAGEVLLGHAEERGADLLVMGGYAHGRLRELVLGGTTRHVLAHATVPVLLSH